MNSMKFHGHGRPIVFNIETYRFRHIIRKIDVDLVGNRNILFCHEEAFLNKAEIYSGIIGIAELA